MVRVACGGVSFVMIWMSSVMADLLDPLFVFRDIYSMLNSNLCIIEAIIIRKTISIHFFPLLSSSAPFRRQSS